MALALRAPVTGLLSAAAFGLLLVRRVAVEERTLGLRQVTMQRTTAHDGAAGPAAPPASGAGRRAMAAVVGAVGARRWLQNLLAFALFVGLTVAITWPQARFLEGVPDLGDPLFSTWKIAWPAHQALRDPRHLFDANIFHPERNTLAYSDASLVSAATAAPLLWGGVQPIVAYNLVVLSGFALSAFTCFLLVRRLTGDGAAAIVAGAAFAFMPFRFGHYSQEELQMAEWIPLGLLALHRVVARPRLRDGLLLGGALALQAYSSLYYGVFFATYLVPVWVVLAVRCGRAWRTVKPLAAGAVLAAVLVAPLFAAHNATRHVVGERGGAEIAFYSAIPGDYLVADARSALYGARLSVQNRPERQLFPGVVVPALAAVALWPPWSPTRLAYAAGLVFAFDASLGVNGVTYPWLSASLLPYRGLRVPARFALLVGLSLAVFAGFGVARLAARLRPAVARIALVVACTLAVCVDSRPVLDLTPAPLRLPVYRWLANRPPAPMVEVPMPATIRDTPDEARYLYFSTFHWHKLVNGYSGFFPKSYADLLEGMRSFPDDRSFEALRRRGVEYLVVHEDLYRPEQFAAIVSALGSRLDVVTLQSFGGAGHTQRLYRLRY